MAFELGIITFGELTPDPVTGKAPSPAQRMRETVQQAEVAEQAGLDVFGVGEHHRSDFVASAPAVILAAAAERTDSIRLTSAVTVLSSDDPVRVFQDFATLDLISGGRAEIIVGRGSYTESFPLFGYGLDQYTDLFREKLELLLQIREQNPLTWSGSLRPALQDADIAPRPAQSRLPISVGVGGTPASAVRTGMLGLPMTLAFIFGRIDSHVRTTELYRHAATEAGHDPEALPVAASVHGFVDTTSQGARDLMYPYFNAGMGENGHQRGRPFGLPRAAFDAQTSPGASLLVGSPQEVIEKILTFHETYGLTRLVAQMGFGGVPQKDHLRAIEVLGTEVAPVVRQEIASKNSAPDQRRTV